MPPASLLDPNRRLTRQATPPARPHLAANFVVTNRAMVSQIYQDVCTVGRHPLAAVEQMGAAMAWPLIHPVQAARHLWRGIQADPLGGGVDAASEATGEAYVGLILIAGAATLAAPLGGEALAAASLGIADKLGYLCLGLDAAGIALYEGRGTLASSTAEARDEGSQAASYAEDEALCIGTWVAGDAVQARGYAKSATVNWLVNDTIGLPGVYDPAPVAKQKS